MPDEKIKALEAASDALVEPDGTVLESNLKEFLRIEHKIMDLLANKEIEDGDDVYRRN